MANWHLVLAYDNQAADWLAAQGYQRPLARSDNRLPTQAEIENAERTLGIGSDAPLLVDCAGLPESFAMRGDLILQLQLLRRLSQLAGQLWLYPDCGSPAIVVDSTTDPETVSVAWLRSLRATDPWSEFLGRQ
ncbi:MAG: hypothetical protein ACTHN5_22560 [Phycisphaerae bacterium]